MIGITVQTKKWVPPNFTIHKLKNPKPSKQNI